MAGWLYTQQSYDWQGRPLVTTNTDGTTKEASYSGCGCSGGEVVTLTDEGTMDAGVFKRRQQKIYSDVLGRTIKTEVLNWQGGSVYSTTVNSYDARDQISRVLQYAGPEGGPTLQETTMTYDGYGRLKTKHVPEQNAGTATTWDYNPDDTVQKVTDARGAATTFGYNGRHLVTSVVYPDASSLPSGVQPTSNVSFAYDAAGNRISMTDGLGNVSYSYDQLSRLTAETRYFSALGNSATDGNYGISYGYNFANQLTSITDPFSAQIGYTRDTTGRTTAVTGSSFAGVTQYVRGVNYRAWGAVKAASYGNASYSANWSSTTQYNGRLQPSGFQLTDNTYGTSLMSENYTYGGDRRLASLTDLNDTAGSNPPATLRFLTRSFGYDQVGRVNQVYSPNTAPLNQTYESDEFRNMKGRSGTYYWQPSQSDASSFSNNRRNGWSYNADGQLTANPASITDNAHTFNYDAANRLSNSTETIASGASSYSPVYDGDGKLVYESQVTTGTSASSSSSYAVRATVLGSQILTRLDQNGNKSVTYVPAEGLIFATQNVTQNGNSVGWTQRDPVGISETGRGIYDPLGNYIPFQQHDDPRPPAGSYNSSSMGGFYASFASNPFQLNIGCIRDGIPTDCNKVLHDINRGLAGQVIIGGTQNPNVVLANAGFIPQVRSQEVSPNFPDPLDERNALHYPVDVIDSVAIVPGRQPTPQNTGREMAKFDLDKLKECVRAYGFDPNSIQFTPSQKGKGGSFEGYAPWDTQRTSGVRVENDLSYNSRQLGNIDHSRSNDGITILDLNLEIYTATLMHELIHGLQGRGSDDTLDRNIRKLGIVPIGKDGKPLPFPTGMRDGKPFNDWSGYWHRDSSKCLFSKCSKLSMSFCA